jgi:hypothetical protein
VRRKTLEGELAKLYEANATARAHFDERLLALFSRRIQVQFFKAKNTQKLTVFFKQAELQVFSLELQVLVLARAVSADDSLANAAASRQVFLLFRRARKK